MNQHNLATVPGNRKAEDAERACWFARLAFGDWSNSRIPEPTSLKRSKHCVLP